MRRRITVAGLLIAAVAALALMPARASAAGGQSGCIAHRPAYIEDVFEPGYLASCSGHDEPELNPLSNLPGSAKNLTWTFQLPGNGSHFDVDAVGPTFWFGGPVIDPTSLFGQAFEELQFYPNTVVSKCNSNGGSTYKHVRGVYTICSPTWALHATGQKPSYHEPAAFNGMVRDAAGGGALRLHQGDRVSVRFFVTGAQDGWHITVTDLTSGHHGTIVLNSKTDGPLMPAYSVQKIGNSLKWGAVHDAPASFVWEIGHTSQFSSPSTQFCWPGESVCQSYNAPAWRDQSPIRIESVRFGDGSAPTGWSVVSDYGGKAEVLDPTETGSTCSSYGGPFCIYPWFTQNRDGSFSYGVNSATTADDFGRADQFQQATECGGPFGPNSTYCSTIIR